MNPIKNDLSSLRKILGRSLEPLKFEFYRRNTVEVAQELLGKVLCVRLFPDYSWDDTRAQVTAGRIVETEAYRAGDDAAHCSRGETPRCSIMFGQPGVAYVYFIYGMYEMLNFVTEPKGHPGAVLIRAVEPLCGEALMKQRRKLKSESPQRLLTSGPGKLCRALGVQMLHHGESLTGPSLVVGDDGCIPRGIARSTRVGIRLAQDKLWRFYIPDNDYVSRISKVRHSEHLGK